MQAGRPNVARHAVPGFGRRALLRGAVAGALCPRLAAAAVEAPVSWKLLVAGPAGGSLDHWADLLAPLLGRFLPDGTALLPEPTGGPDGVTAANQFDTREAPDGSTALLLPGEAMLAWLAGDPRARFDPTRWQPVLTACTSAVLVSRVPAGSLAPGRRLRLAASTPGGRELPSMLALQMAGIEPVPVFGLRDPNDAAAALHADAVDAVHVQGATAALRVAALAPLATPLFSAGMADGNGQVTRDPAFPGVPAVPELVAHLRGSTALDTPMYRAWSAAAAAGGTDFAMVLPALAQSSAGAAWRHAAQAARADFQPAAPGERLDTPPDATARLPGTAADTDTLLELRHWLAARHDQLPG